MKIEVILAPIVMLLMACNSKKNDPINANAKNMVSADTMVGSKSMFDQIPGSAFEKRAIGYFLVINNDTSDYTCIFRESKDGGRVGISLNFTYSNPTMTYRERLNELRPILARASKDFNFDSLSSISFGRLILSGDLAIDVSKEYLQKFGTGNKLENYPTVSSFLKESKLGTDLNNLFKPYSIVVDTISIEKLFFSSTKQLYNSSKIETDSANVPDKILDCLTWVSLTRK